MKLVDYFIYLWINHVLIKGNCRNCRLDRRGVLNFVV